MNGAMIIPKPIPAIRCTVAASRTNPTMPAVSAMSNAPPPVLMIRRASHVTRVMCVVAVIPDADALEDSTRRAPSFALFGRGSPNSHAEVRRR
ncbi:hypothetical protein GCM10020260_01420 [Nesterenkonia halobia]|uniref:Uncharacterized protein n=1 Tax=Nesterenkonia halobia TaxID=37922 RepID=A0ABP6R879_9MICC